MSKMIYSKILNGISKSKILTNIYIFLVHLVYAPSMLFDPQDDLKGKIDEIKARSRNS